jgi:hypothetical protein
MARALRFASVTIAFASFVLGACGGDDTVFVTNGSNDVRRACEVRARWTNTKSVLCLECLATAPIPSCECTTVAKTFTGKCAQQLTLKKASPNCDDALTRCVGTCGQTDCGCLDLCYSSRAECRARASALDGCVAEVCDEACR